MQCTSEKKQDKWTNPVVNENHRSEKGSSGSRNHVNNIIVLTNNGLLLLLVTVSAHQFIQLIYCSVWRLTRDEVMRLISTVSSVDDVVLAVSRLFCCQSDCLGVETWHRRRARRRPSTRYKTASWFFLLHHFSTIISPHLFHHHHSYHPNTPSFFHFKFKIFVFPLNLILQRHPLLFLTDYTDLWSSIANGVFACGYLFFSSASITSIILFLISSFYSLSLRVCFLSLGFLTAVDLRVPFFIRTSALEVFGYSYYDDYKFSAKLNVTRVTWHSDRWSGYTRCARPFSRDAGRRTKQQQAAAVIHCLIKTSPTFSTVTWKQIIGF